MSLNFQAEGVIDGGFQQSSTPDIGQLVLAIKELVIKEVEMKVIQTVERIIMPEVENCFRKVLKKELISAIQKFLTPGDESLSHEMHTSTENRSLKLKFLNEVAHTVLTGKDIEPKEGTAMKLAIVDKTEKVVTSGPSASAKVEICLLKVNHDDSEQNWSGEDFDDRIISESDKKKPHFRKSVYVQLEEGIGYLYKVKLGHDSSWMKSCECRLGARIVDKFCGITVKEAWTKPFTVQDSRSKLYEKHHPPSLRDEVWRLVNIARDGGPCKRLRKEKIFTVQKFLFLLSADPQKLLSIVSDKKINSDSKMWKATVDHARNCIIDDKKIYLYSSSEFEFTVAFDAIATLRGIIRDSHFVPLDHMSDVEKDRARELISRASVLNLEDLTSMADENSVLDRFPHESNGINSAIDSTILESSLGCENNDELDPLETGISSQTISVCPMQSNDLELDDSEIREQTCDRLDVPYEFPRYLIEDYGLYDYLNLCPLSPMSDPFSLAQQHYHNEEGIFLTQHPGTCLPNNDEPESSYNTKNKAPINHVFTLLAVPLWFFRIRKRARGTGIDQVRKKQRCK